MVSRQVVFPLHLVHKPYSIFIHILYCLAGNFSTSSLHPQPFKFLAICLLLSCVFHYPSHPPCLGSSCKFLLLFLLARLIWMKLISDCSEWRSRGCYKVPTGIPLTQQLMYLFCKELPGTVRTVPHPGPWYRFWTRIYGLSCCFEGAKHMEATQWNVWDIWGITCLLVHEVKCVLDGTTTWCGHSHTSWCHSKWAWWDVSAGWQFAGSSRFQSDGVRANEHVRWQCCMVTTATQGISGGLDPLPVWGCQSSFIRHLHRWWNGECSLDTEGRGEVKYPGWTWKLTYDSLPSGNQDLGRSGNCKWEAAVAKLNIDGDECNRYSYRSETNRRRWESLYQLSHCNVEGKEKPPNYDLNAATTVLWWIHLVLNFLEIK